MVHFPVDVLGLQQLLNLLNLEAVVQLRLQGVLFEALRAVFLVVDLLLLRDRALGVLNLFEKHLILSFNAVRFLY